VADTTDLGECGIASTFPKFRDECFRKTRTGVAVVTSGDGKDTRLWRNTFDKVAGGE